MGVLDGNGFVRIMLRALVVACQVSIIPIKIALINLYYFIASWKPLNWLEDIPTNFARKAVKNGKIKNKSMIQEGEKLNSQVKHSLKSLHMWGGSLYKNYLYIIRQAYQGLPAPDGDVVELSSNETKSLLSFGKPGRPLILNFGSFT